MLYNLQLTRDYTFKWVQGLDNKVNRLNLCMGVMTNPDDDLRRNTCTSNKAGSNSADGFHIKMLLCFEDYQDTDFQISFEVFYCLYMVNYFFNYKAFFLYQTKPICSQPGSNTISVVAPKQSKHYTSFSSE